MYAMCRKQVFIYYINLVTIERKQFSVLNTTREQVDLDVTLSDVTPEMQGSNLGRHTRYPVKILCCFS
jgi:hypothetical protein